MDTPNAVEPLAAPTNDPKGEVCRLEDLLARCNVDEAMLAILPMTEALPLPRDVDATAFIALFRSVVWKYPLWAVREVVSAFVAGEVSAHTSPFCPNTAVFGRELATRVAWHQAKLGIARRQADEASRLAAEPKRIPRSDEAKARGEAQIKRLRELADADRARRNLAHRTGMTRAQIERERSQDGDSCG